jgi:hypothetical protein
MKVIITTSDLYHHLLPIFFKLYVREWNWPCELVGYKKPVMELPECCTWVSLGVQRGPKYFSDDLRPYFEKQDQFFIWIMEDTFLKGVDFKLLELSIKGLSKWIGKWCLTNESTRRDHRTMNTIYKSDLFEVAQDAKYRLSCQPAIWNREYLVASLKPGLSPWEWETQHPVNDGYDIVGFKENVVRHNEGVTKKDIHKLNLTGIEL